MEGGGLAGIKHGPPSKTPFRGWAKFVPSKHGTSVGLHVRSWWVTPSMAPWPNQGPGRSLGQPGAAAGHVGDSPQALIQGPREKALHWVRVRSFPRDPRKCDSLLILRFVIWKIQDPCSGLGVGVQPGVSRSQESEEEVLMQPVSKLMMETFSGQTWAPKSRLGHAGTHFLKEKHLPLFYLSNRLV